MNLPVHLIIKLLKEQNFNIINQSAYCDYDVGWEDTFLIIVEYDIIKETRIKNRKLVNTIIEYVTLACNSEAYFKPVLSKYDRTKEKAEIYVIQPTDNR